MWISSERLGGTIDRSNKTITSATTRLGRFVVMQEPEPTLGEEAKITQLTCQPRIFSPKGGGFDTCTAISFNLTKSARVTIKIYNRAGKPKRLLEESKEMSQGVNVVFWDGMDDDKNIVGSDLYIVTITVGDATVTKTVAVSNR
jgi:flagellar hook assembly protein FlgD